jgi:hypothetical protein
MTRDIVTKLRSPNAPGANWRRLYGGAADEIERLRAALDKIACCNFSIETIADLVDRVANHARAALKDKQ